MPTRSLTHLSDGLSPNRRPNVPLSPTTNYILRGDNSRRLRLPPVRRRLGLICRTPRYWGGRGHPSSPLRPWLDSTTPMSGRRRGGVGGYMLTGGNLPSTPWLTDPSRYGRCNGPFTGK